MMFTRICFMRVPKSILVFVLSVCLSLPASWAGAPAQINYQGKLANAAGNPVTNAAQTIQVEIFDQLTNGACVFGPETHTVDVGNGVFSLQIGSIAVGLGAALRSGTDLYLEVTIDPGLVTEAVLIPRQRLVAAPYALAVAADSVGTTELSDDAVTSVKIDDGSITNADINAAAGISAGKLSGVLTAGGNRTDANLDTLTAGAGSDADSLHTHSGLTPADHAGTHAPAGTDSLESVYTSLSTDQTINGLKTFNPPAAGAPFALGANGQNQLVTGLNADLLDGQTASDFALSAHNHSAGNITSGVLDLARGGTGADLSGTGGANQFVRQNTAGGAFTVSAITDADVPDTITASNYLPLTGGDVNGRLSITGGNDLCLGGVCESAWPDAGAWLDGVGANEIYYDLAFVGIGTDDPAYDLDVNGSINAQTNLCIGADCIDSWNAVPPWTVGTGPDRIYYTAGNVGIGPGVVMPSQALDVAGNIAVTGTVDGVNVSDLQTQVDNIDVNDSVEASELISLFSGAAGLLRKIDADNYGTLGSLPGSMIDNDAITSAHLAEDSVRAEQIDADAVGASEIRADAVRSSEIAPDAVGSSEIVVDAVGSDEIGVDAVGLSEMADNAVGSAEIIDGSITADDLDTTYAEYAFSTISVPGTNPVADSASDTLTLNAGSNITISGSGADTITISASSGGDYLPLSGGTMENPASNIDMNTAVITNIGDADTDFTAAGGLNVAHRIGIGKTDPTYPLDVVGQARVSSDLFVGYVNCDAGAQFGGTVMIGTPSDTTNLTLFGDLSISGTANANVKNFEIDHPLDPENMKLVHSVVEGPEIAVFYRGESKLVKGRVVIELPHYFESLTRKENRTVQLTCKDGGSILFVSGEIKDGKFEVKTTKDGNQNQAFYWEVKAVRADVDPLVVERNK